MLFPPRHILSALANTDLLEHDGVYQGPSSAEQWHCLPSNEIRSPNIRATTRIQGWGVLALEVVKAEHPHFEVVSCFQVFDLDVWPEQTVDELLRHGRTTIYDESLTRLSTTFSVDVAALQREFWDLGARAKVEYKHAKCTIQEAWERAVARTSSSGGRQRHPVENLQIVLAEYVCISCSDSIIEHDFSRLKQLFGEHRLNAKEDSFDLIHAPSHFQRVANSARSLILFANVPNPQNVAPRTR